jgi:hypothetical protein
LRWAKKTRSSNRYLLKISLHTFKVLEMIAADNYKALKNSGYCFSPKAFFKKDESLRSTTRIMPKPGAPDVISLVRPSVMTSRLSWLTAPFSATSSHPNPLIVNNFVLLIHIFRGGPFPRYGYRGLGVFKHSDFTRPASVAVKPALNRGASTVLQTAIVYHMDMI